ncbi:MAG: pyrroline-5-carboxylate reductase, partial [Oscillospiraceae bacterium]
IAAVFRGVTTVYFPIYVSFGVKTAELSKKTGCRVAASADEAASNAHFVFLCVKPNILHDTLRGICPVLSGKVVVSIAAGVAKSSIKAVLAEAGLDLPVIRLMPNTPVAVGKGMILVSPDKDVLGEDIALVLEALAPGGLTSIIDESYIDAATPVFSCSPAYVYMFIEALADGGVMAGIPRDKAQSYAAQAVLGAAAMVLETGKHPGELKDAVCSPGGSTIVGVEELEKSAFRGAVASAVFEAYKKTTGLGK